MEITDIYAREILDSRGVPTIECTVMLHDGTAAVASVPSGASVGKHEAVELRDNDAARYAGKGVRNAIQHIEKQIAPALRGKPADVALCDEIMLQLDGTVNKCKLGANAMLAVSMAVARAQSKELWQLFHKDLGLQEKAMPLAMYNVLNGGAHAHNSLTFQEFMIMPVGKASWSEQLRVAVDVTRSLKALLIEAGHVVSVGDEGGFAPNLLGEEEALAFLAKAVTHAGYTLGKDIVFCLDVAASQFYNSKESVYMLGSRRLTAQGLIDVYKALIDAYPIYSIEDGLAEDDWDGWKLMTSQLGSQVKLVGDDIFVSHYDRIRDGASQEVANTVLIKPNQIGTVSECLDSIRLCKKLGYNIVVSHRSGETNDTFIADLAVGVQAAFIKAGAPTRGERVAKYNRLLQIELDLQGL